VEDFQLKVFRVAAERLNFTQAAERLYLTQPAVTLQIKHLEADLSVRLFDRSGRGLRLTPAGEVLLGFARRIEDLYAEARGRIGELSRDVRGTLSLGVSTTISQYVLPRVLAAFGQAHPGVRVSVTSGNTEIVLQGLTRGSIELALIEGPPHTPGIKLSHFLKDEIMLIVPREHPWASADQALSPSKLQTTPLLLRERGSGTRDVVEAALKAAGLDISSLEVPMSLDSTEAIKSAVEVGLGVGLVSQWELRESNIGALAVVPLANLRIRRDFDFAYPQGPAPSGLAGLFIEFAAEFGARMPPPSAALERGNRAMPDRPSLL
jgi:LysR family transcriptional regulator, transcriptional activator of the cysJI operon